MRTTLSMQLYFIRHAQSENNENYWRTNSSQGRSTDPELTELGLRQAAALARFLSQTNDSSNIAYGGGVQNAEGFDFTHLYSSLQVRAVCSGLAIAKALDMPLVAWPNWHEVGGIFEKDEATGEYTGLPGKSRAYFETHYPDLQLPDELNEQGWWNRPFEDDAQQRERAQRMVAELQARHSGTEDRVAIVSHGGFYNRMLKALFQMPADIGCWFTMNNAAITRIDFTEDEFFIVYQNRVDFLPPALLTL